MPTQITSYKVFIASPGGLDRERREFHETLQKHNQADALPRACMFDPVGWEITLGGVGRPQEKINEELRQCDFFVLVLWDRWGSPTGSKEGHTSGTEEEYKVAQACFADERFPLQEMVVFFKAVDARQLSDPGLQLQAVLKFKKDLEESKTALFETFDTPESFGEKLRRHLSKWTRGHEAGLASGAGTQDASVRASEAIVLEEKSGADLSNSDPKDTSFIETIEKIYKAGNLTESEQKLVSDLISKRSIYAYYSYGLFLLKAERFSDAEGVFSEMSKLAQSESETSWAATAEARLGAAFRMQGKMRQSQEALQRSITLNQAAGDDRGEMSAHIWLGDLHLQFKRYEKALASYNAALALVLDANLSDEKIGADIRLKCAKCLAYLGRNDEAIRESELAKEVYAKLKDSNGLKAVKHWRKSKGFNARKPGPSN